MLCVDVCVQSYPARDVIVDAKAVEKYRKRLPFKNSGLESKKPTQEDLFFTNRRDLEYDIMQSQLDPESICRYVVCIVETLYIIIRTTVRQDKVS